MELPSRTLPALDIGDSVRMKNNKNNRWSTKAKVVSKHNTPRSYVVQTEPGTTYRRNRQHLLKTDESWIYTPQHLDDDIPGSLPDGVELNPRNNDNRHAQNPLDQRIEEPDETDGDTEVREDPILQLSDSDSVNGNDNDTIDINVVDDPQTIDINNDDTNADEVINFIRLHYQWEDYRRFSMRSNFGRQPDRYGYY